MKQKLRATALILSVLSIGACSDGHDIEETPGVIQLSGNGPSVAVVNGEPVPAVLLDALARGRGLDLADAKQRQSAVDELTDYVLLAQDAAAQRLLDQPAAAAGVELVRLQSVANLMSAQLQASAPITDAMVKAEYDAEIARIGTTEYRVAHLLFDQEDKALQATGAITRGQAFEAVLEEHKADAKQARELGWAKLPQLPAEFANAMQEMQPGQTSLLPVKTEFGWHIIHLYETRPFAAPELEKLAPGIRQSLAERVHRERLATLRAKAQIKLVEAAAGG